MSQDLSSPPGTSNAPIASKPILPHPKVSTRCSRKTKPSTASPAPTPNVLFTNRSRNYGPPKPPALNRRHFRRTNPITCRPVISPTAGPSLKSAETKTAPANQGENSNIAACKTKPIPRMAPHGRYPGNCHRVTLPSKTTATGVRYTKEVCLGFPNYQTTFLHRFPIFRSRPRCRVRQFSVASLARLQITQRETQHRRYWLRRQGVERHHRLRCRKHRGPLRCRRQAGRG